MTKIARIKTDLNIDVKEFTDILRNKELLIFEDIQGSKVFVQWNGERFIIKPKSLNMDELNIIDLTVQKFYNYAFEFFHTLPDSVTELLNKNWWFCFEYFPKDDVQPANIEYKRFPKNGLILSCIVKGTKYFYEYEELMEYSKLFDVECLPVIFKGRLTSKQLEVIELYLKTSEKDLDYIFGDDIVNFAYFFYQILNPNLENSFLMNNKEFNDNLEKIIIKIDKNSQYSFEILNPLYQRLSNTNNTNYTEIYSLILLSFLEFCQLKNINKYKLERITKDQLYIEFICEIFNKYVENMGKDIIRWNFDIPDFFREDKFKINIDLLNNKETIKNIKSNEKIEYIFKIVLGSFNKKRKKPIGVFDEHTLIMFNNFVDKLSSVIENRLKINRETSLTKGDLHDFKSYFQLKYDQMDDGSTIIPDVYDEFEEGEGKKKKKGVEPLKKGKSPFPTEPFTPKKEQL